MKLRTKKFLYTRVEPTKDAKLIVIYCEGKKREKDYGTLCYLKMQTIMRNLVLKNSLNMS